MSLTVSHVCYMSLKVSHFFWLSLTVSVFLSLSLPAPWMSLTVSYGFCLSQTVSPVPWSCYMSITVSSSSMEFLQILSLSLMLAGFLFHYHGAAA